MKHPGKPVEPIKKMVIVNGDGKKSVRQHIRRVKATKPPIVPDPLGAPPEAL